MNRLTAESVLIIANIGKYAEIKRGTRVGVYADCLERLTQCIHILLDTTITPTTKTQFLSSCHVAFTTLVNKQKLMKNKISERDKVLSSHADDLIQFRQLRSQAVQGMYLYTIVFIV